MPEPFAVHPETAKQVLRYPLGWCEWPAIAGFSIERPVVSKGELSSVIAKLSAEYAEQLPDTVAKMEQLWGQLVAAEIPSSQLLELVRMAHSIAGSGATFGLPDVSAAARELESFLDPFLASKRLPESAEQASVSALLVALRQAAVQR